MIAILGLVLVTGAADAGSIKRWLDSDGNLHFGDAPPAHAVTERVEIKETLPDRKNSMRLQSKSAQWIKARNASSSEDHHEGDAKDDRGWSERLRFRNAAVNGTLLVGMTPNEAHRAWGVPVRINSSGGKQKKREQWVYETPTGIKHIYLRDGRVTSWN
ncbi:MAG: DUF4124 domain-containing protein [Sedimenticola sp.]